MSVIFSKFSGENDSIYGKSEYPIRMIIEKKAEAYEAKSILPYIYNMDNSTNFAEKVSYVTSMEDFVPTNEGGAFAKLSMQEGYSKTLEHVTWKGQFEATLEMLQDNKTIDLRNGAAKFINSYYRTRERFGTRLLGAAFNTSTGPVSLTYGGQKFDASSADGVSLFSKAHPSKTGGKAQSNLYAAPSSGDVFTSAVLAHAETTMQNFKDDNGNILGVSPDTIIIQNNGTMKQLVFGVIGADKSPGTSNNALNYTFGRWNVVVAPEWQTATGTEWILLSSTYNKENAGALWYDRMPLSVKPHVNEVNWNMVWSSVARFVAGFNDWRFAGMFGAAGGTAIA